MLSASLRSIPILLAGGKMRPPVLLPARFIGVGALRTLLAVADGFQPVGRNSELGQKLLGCCSAPVAQAEVIFGRAALVAVSFEDDAVVREIAQDGFERVRVTGEGVARILADVAAVVIKVSVGDFGFEPTG